MGAAIKYHISKEAFLLACNICEQGNPSVTHDAINHDNTPIQNLIKLKAFIAGKKYWLEDKNGEYIDVVYEKNQAGYFDKNNKFVKISYDYLYSYKLDFKWMIKVIADDLEIDKYYPAEIIVDNLFWRIGTIKSKMEIPVFFARAINNKNNFENIYKALLNRKGMNRGVVLSTSESLPLGYNLPGEHQIISLRDCLVYDNNNFHIDKNIVKTAVGIRSKSEKQKEGFSLGYRTAYLNDVQYNFSKKQAAIIEALDKQGGKVNKHELLAEANSEQYDVYRVFRDNKGKYHPAWDIIIKNDGKGNYWLII